MSLDEASLRLLTFVGLFTAFWVLEWLIPRRSTAERWPRQVNNLMLALLGTLLVRVALPLLAIDVARLAGDASLGLLNTVGWNLWLELALAVVLLDFAIYFQHRLFHMVAWAWRLHRVHHGDRFFDVSTGVRFHPVEILASMVIKIGVVLLIGAPVVAVLVFEVILNATSLFNHSNIRIPAAADRALRWLIVTPDMHRVHHSVHADEQQHNFGFNLSVWDRLFGTYKPQPADGHSTMAIGIEDRRSEREQQLMPMLLDPLRRG